jgi:CheY-like chemotaxis protein
MGALSGACRILVVDDDRMVLEVIGDMLTAFGYEVTVTHNPQNAVELIWNEHFDAILTDLGMPVLNGWAVARHVKAKNTSTPVILITGWGAQYEEADLSKSGVDLVLSKPLDCKTLTGAIEELLAHTVSEPTEHRKHWRFRAKKGESAKLLLPALDSPPNLGKLIDISIGGVSFRHRADINCPGSRVSLDLILEDGVEIDSVPCKVIYDIQFQEKSDLGQIEAARRCGVQFEELSESQLSQLESCIRRRALAEAA